MPSVITPCGGLTIADEGIALPSRGELNFTGAGVTATDDPGNDRTNVDIPGGSSGGGIQFDTSPQSGGFLTVTTTSGPMTFTDTSASGISFDTTGDATVIAQGAVTITADGSGVMNLSATSQQINITTNGLGSNINLLGMNANVLLFGKYGVNVETNDASAVFSVTHGFSVIMRIDSDGTWHGPTGGHIDWDL